MRHIQYVGAHERGDPHTGRLREAIRAAIPLLADTDSNAALYAAQEERVAAAAQRAGRVHILPSTMNGDRQQRFNRESHDLISFLLQRPKCDAMGWGTSVT